MSITPLPPGQAKGKGSNMGQFSVEKPVAPGSVLSGNQTYTPTEASAAALLQRPPLRFPVLFCA
jgi:hypothetical protein